MIRKVFGFIIFIILIVFIIKGYFEFKGSSRFVDHYINECYSVTEIDLHKMIQAVHRGCF
ncbi:hypothetical protein SAMN05216249_10190 [Acetitomaculum ruminis DSM 5522]|uniref:Uncharacterized protein n=1 Tax=Acetitomaculum ruminis DSM 5522 TaxID=1120918 RepID=A0A1I0V0H1_9FIRM|nr:hypothetical protein [Acetitomaculum ruminis]SFA69839.1 hypothetical protein SAMN05216249_10190 [Acetitomaculum ruminis DSM 5522]